MTAVTEWKCLQTFRSDADYNKTTLSKCLCLTSPREYIVHEDCPRVSILPGLDEGKSRSRSCQRTAQGAPQRLLLCGIVGRESLYRTTVMGTLTHTGWSKATWSGPRRFRYKTSRDLLKLSIFVVNSEAWFCWLLMCMNVSYQTFNFTHETKMSISICWNCF